MSTRVPVQKTYKLYIGGEFPRSESGRTFDFNDAKGRHIANVSRGSRKDFRNAVVVARSAQKSWAGKSAYNRGQILYRLGEMVEGRRDQFIAELQQQGSSVADARREVDDTIDTLIHYAGWSDKYQQLFSTVNPVASPHFSFSVPEPTGVVALIAPQDSALLGLVNYLAPIIVGGNTVIALASDKKPLSAITFSEVIATSDVPAGVVNILTGYRSELLSQIAGHMDVNAVVYAGDNVEDRKTIQSQASLNVKRAIFSEKQSQSPYAILATQETKTTWHPIGL
ncbi:MAG: NAD/NADP-dependent betaine aldehyde dehydrogenase [Verrucomicrobiae bacterium]|nr:NAD/NADP-dependent betaine aldehyde dehydrogenase [Verrucomicrobiae bacterium]